jgi:hypothetical protein
MLIAYFRAMSQASLFAPPATPARCVFDLSILVSSEPSRASGGMP